MGSPPYQQCSTENLTTTKLCPIAVAVELGISRSQRCRRIRRCDWQKYGNHPWKNEVEQLRQVFPQIAQDLDHNELYTNCHRLQFLSCCVQHGADKTCLESAIQKTIHQLSGPQFYIMYTHTAEGNPSMTRSVQIFENTTSAPPSSPQTSRSSSPDSIITTIRIRAPNGGTPPSPLLRPAPRPRISTAAAPPFVEEHEYSAAHPPPPPPQHKTSTSTKYLINQILSLSAQNRALQEQLADATRRAETLKDKVDAATRQANQFLKLYKQQNRESAVVRHKDRVISDWLFEMERRQDDSGYVWRE